MAAVMKRYKVYPILWLFFISLVLFAITTVASPLKPITPPTTPTSGEEAKEMAKDTPASAPGMEVKSQTPATPNVTKPATTKKSGSIPPGLNKREQGKQEDGKPFGWSQGKKEGWSSDIPPGLEKKGGQLPPGLTKP